MAMSCVSLIGNEKRNYSRLVGRNENRFLNPFQFQFLNDRHNL